MKDLVQRRSPGRKPRTPSPPRLSGSSRDARHRYSWNGGPWYPSVTTILRIKDKPALVGWAKRETAACAVRNLDVLEKMVRSGGPAAAVDWLKRIPDYARDTAADLGTAVHAAAEAIGRGEPVAVGRACARLLAAYRRDFLDVFAPRFLAVEAMVCSERYEYGGTADAFVEIDGETWLLDYKTGAGVYPDTALQLAGLARAQFIGYPGDPAQYPMPLRHPLRDPPRPARGCAALPGHRGPGDRGGLPRCAPPVWLGPGAGQERHRGADRASGEVRGRLTASQTLQSNSDLPCSADIPPPDGGAPARPDPVPPAVRAHVRERDRGCVFARLGYPPRVPRSA